MDKQRTKLAVGRRGQPDVVRQRDRGEVRNVNYKYFKDSFTRAVSLQGF